MINPADEKLIALREVPAMVPPHANGKPRTVRAVYRWAKAGHRGVTLETLKAPGGLCTSREAVVRFLERLSLPVPNTKVLTTSQRNAARRRAAEILDSAGIK